MPYIGITTNVSLSEETKVALKSELGRAIGLIPGKVESGLMVGFTEAELFHGGVKCDAAYVAVKIFGQTTNEAWEALVVEITRLLGEYAKIEPKHVYINVEGFPIWGSGGKLKV